MPRLECILRRYIQVHLAQVAQCAACNRLHELEARLSRWLLMCHDRAERNLVPLTQDFLAQMLGCRRSSVTTAAGCLQKASLIDYSRGRLMIVNRKGLETRACECYKTMKRYASAVLG
ncbi:MAG: Crp/Fnr family transcriptional regulator [Terriglobales bacterium]